MNGLSLLPGGSPPGAPPVDGVGLAAGMVQSLQAPGSAPVVASQPVAAPAGGPNLQVPMGKGTRSRMAGAGGDVWAAILSALKPGPTGARLDYGILDPKKRGDYMTGLAERTLDAGPKGA